MTTREALTAEELALVRGNAEQGLYGPYASHLILRLFAILDTVRTKLDDCDEALTTVEVAYDRDVPLPGERAARAPGDGLREAAQEYLDATSEPAYSWVVESQAARREGRPNRETQRVERIARAGIALRAALASPGDAAEDKLCPWCGHPPVCHKGPEGECVASPGDAADREVAG